MERRFTSRQQCRIERRAEGKAGMLVGYAAVYFDAQDVVGTQYPLWTGAVERVMPGAFDRAIRERQDVRGLSNHNVDTIVGRTLAGTMRLSTDAVGLRYEIDLPETEAARTLATAIERGDVSGSSFSFRTVSQNWRNERLADGVTIEIRELLDVDLFDVGPVVFPAYESTTVATREAGELAEARAAYDEWNHASKLASPHRSRDAVTARARAIAVGR